jgi:hypothetical protein
MSWKGGISESPQPPPCCSNESNRRLLGGISATLFAGKIIDYPLQNSKQKIRKYSALCSNPTTHSYQHFFFFFFFFFLLLLQELVVSAACFGAFYQQPYMIKLYEPIEPIGKMLCTFVS